jgi:hypothetical protein
MDILDVGISQTYAVPNLIFGLFTPFMLPRPEGFFGGL